MKWFNIEKAPPPENENILLASINYDIVTIGICEHSENGLEFFTDEENAMKLQFVTHWMPLPEPPNK